MAKPTSITFGTAGIDPSTLADETALRHLVRSALALACEQHLEPNLQAPAPRDRRFLMAHMRDAEAAYVLSLMKKQGAKVPVASAIGRLVDAAMPQALARAAASAPVSADDSLAQVLGALKLGGRDEQRALFRNIQSSLNSSSTGLVAAQASTGIGKTVVAHSIAMDWLRGNLGAKPHSVVVVAFPSLHGVKSFAAQWQLSRDSGLDLPAMQMLLGRREFVSRNALVEMLDDPATTAPHLSSGSIASITAWLADQDAQGSRATWWMDSLLDVESQLDRDALCINSLSGLDDPGVARYGLQFTTARTSSVIVCSHHMLAIDVLLRQRGLSQHEQFVQARTAARDAYFSADGKAERDQSRAASGAAKSLQEVIAQMACDHESMLLANGETLEQRRLPPYQHLIVDEAHLLEQAFSACFSASVPLRETSRRLAQLAKLDGRKEVRTASTIVSNACKDMAHLGKDGESLSFKPNLVDEHGSIASLRVILWELSRVKPPRNGKEAALPLLAALDRDRQFIERALDANSSTVRLLDFSPVKHYPHLVVGRGDVSQPLHMLWAGVQSAVLLSATLYMRRSDGFSARYVANLQSVPSHRLREIPVIDSAWLTAPIVSLQLPPRLTELGDGHALPWLLPPSRKHRLDPAALVVAEDRWLDDVAAQLAEVYRTGQGGMLVPCTSHDMVARLASRLAVHFSGDLGPVVLASRDFPSLGAMRQAAFDVYRAGRRFIMLATGAAWTGFDLSSQALGEEASEDNLLTDLVLPRLPFGMNRSLTHRCRMENRRDPVSHEVMSVVLLLQQALGRLVRRPGLPRNRRIFILDRRLTDPSLAGWIAPVRRVVDHYLINPKLVHELTPPCP